MEEEMAEKPSKPRSQREKQHPADSSFRGIKNKESELGEEDLKKISGGEVEHKGIKF
jgi:hypothetical protein